MKEFKQWFHTMTLGKTKEYLKLLAWCLFDSFAVSIPYAVMVMAMYCMLMPVENAGSSLPIGRLWFLVCVLFIQFVSYIFIRRKSYLDFCIGFVGTTKTSRIEMGEHLKKLSMGFFNNRDAGELSTVILRDYTEIETFSQQLLPQVATIVIRFVLAGIVLASFDIRMMLAVFFVIPLAIPFAFISMKRMEKEGAYLQKSQQETSSAILEYVGGIRDLKAFHLVGEHFETLKKSLENQREAAVNIETKAAAPISMIGRFLLNCGIGVVMLVGGYLFTGGSLHPFYYMVFMILSLTLYDPVLLLFTFVADCSRMTRSGNRIRALFEEKPIEESENPKTPKKFDIEFSNVSFGYSKGKEVLHDINMKLEEKSVTALVGSSGSGKSTITRLIARFWDVDKGKVTIGGVSIKDMSSEELMAYISMVFQDVYLFRNTIAENIRMGYPDATDEEVIEAAKKAACHDFISALPNGYQTIVGEGGSTLSGGEKQRISIARALLKDAPIVLLDEATASLDPENEVLIQQAISALVEQKTVIVIAHRLQSICNADKIIVLNEGNIKEEGTHEELLEMEGIYATLWREQNRAGSWRIRD